MLFAICLFLHVIFFTCDQVIFFFFCVSFIFYDSFIFAQNSARFIYFYEVIHIWFIHFQMIHLFLHVIFTWIINFCTKLCTWFIYFSMWSSRFIHFLPEILFSQTIHLLLQVIFNWFAHFLHDSFIFTWNSAHDSSTFTSDLYTIHSFSPDSLSFAWPSSRFINLVYMKFCTWFIFHTTHLLISFHMIRMFKNVYFISCYLYIIQFVHDSCILNRDLWF